MLEFEHSLFKLLLLVAVLNAKPPERKWLPFFIGGSFILAFLPPTIKLPVPWDLLLAMTIPLLLWQNALRIIATRWEGKSKDIMLWIGASCVIALVFLGFKELELAGALLFGLVATSMIWSAGETENPTSLVSLIGPFTLILLLAEVEPMIQSPTHYVGGIFSGLSLGAVISFAAIYFSKKASTKARRWIALSQLYLAYGVASFMGVSAVAASLTSVIVYVTIGLYLGFWPHKRVEPEPLNTWPGFIFILILFLLLGWQAHYPLSSTFFLEVAVGFILGLIIAWVGRQLKLAAFPKNFPLWRTGLRVLLLLFPALLIWPYQTLQQPDLLAYAFGITVISLGLIKITLDYFLSD